MVGVAVYAQVDNVGIRRVFPLLFLAMVMQFLPVLLPRKPDPFCPAAFSGLLTGTALVAVLFAMLDSGRLEIGALPTMTPARREEVVDLVCVAYIVGASAYYAGYYLTKGRLGSGLFPQLANRTWRGSRLLLVSTFCVLVFVPAYAFFQARVGTSLAELTLAEGKDVWKEDPTLSWMHRGIALGFIPLLLHGALALHRREWRRALVVGFIAMVVAFLAMRVGTRGVTVLFLLNLLILGHYLYRRVPVSVLMVGGLFLIAVLNVLGTARSSGPGAELEFSAERFRPGQALVDHESDRQRLTAAAVVMYTFPDRLDYLMGTSWQAIVLAPIPRWVLPNKNHYLRWSDSGITYSLVGVPAPTPFLFVLFANFGWAGILLGMAAWGAFHRALQNWRERWPGDPNVVLLYSALLLYFGPTLLNVGMTFQTVVPIWVSLWFIARRAARYALPREPVPA